MIGLSIALKNVAFFLISSMVLDLLNQLQILTVVSDRIASAFNRSGPAQAVALDISKAFDRAWYAILIHKRKLYGISGQIFGLFCHFSLIDAFRWF